MIWAAISSDHLVSPYFFNESVNNMAYLNMLQTWFISLGGKVPESIRILQQDGVPTQRALSI
jgi:hypothetical protein